jgi:hypothetical protein
MQRFRHALVL